MSDVTDGAAWAKPVRLAIGRALLESVHDSLIASELAASSHRDPSNVRTAAEAMVSEGLLQRTTPARVHEGPGRPPKHAYGFADGQRDVVRRLVAAEVDLGSLETGYQLVFADASQLVDLMNVLADPSHTADALWGGIVDGSGTEYVVVFPAEAIVAATALMAALEGADIDYRRLHLSVIKPIGQLVADAQAAARTAQGVRVRRNTRRAAGG